MPIGQRTEQRGAQYRFLLPAPLPVVFSRCLPPTGNFPWWPTFFFSWRGRRNEDPCKFRCFLEGAFRSLGFDPMAAAPGSFLFCLLFSLWPLCSVSRLHRLTVYGSQECGGASLIHASEKFAGAVFSVFTWGSEILCGIPKKETPSISPVEASLRVWTQQAPCSEDRTAEVGSL